MAGEATPKAKSAPKHAKSQARAAESPPSTAALASPAIQAPIDYSDVFAIASANMDAFVGATEVWLRGLKSINDELTQFADTRMRAVNATARSISDAEDAKALADASLDYARNAAEEYFAESARVVNLTADLARESWMPLQAQWQNGLQNKTDGK